MLYALSTRHRVKIAWFFLLLFYANVVAAETVPGASIGKTSFASSSSATFPTYNRQSQKADVYPHSAVPHSLVANAPALPPTNAGGSVKEQETMIEPKSGFHYEDDSDPGQPEMQSFKSIGTDNMVDLFTGDFSYNIPLLDVGGYPVNIFYNSGITMDQEASWVGLGWNLNPGTISRNMRGLPDDFDGTDKVKKTMSIKEDITVGANVNATSEIVGFPLGKLSVGLGIFYNNCKGFGLEASTGLSISDKSANEKTHAVSPTAGLSFKFNSQQGATISPSLGIRLYNSDKATSTDISASTGYNSRIGIQSLQLSGESKKYENGKIAKSAMGLFGGSISFARPAITPSIRMPISRTSYNVGVNVGVEEFFSFTSVGASGYFTTGRIADADKTQTKPAYGYLHMDKGQKDDEGLTDFNRINDGVYTKNTPVISFPAYTYDVYSISGEGTGGSFRPYRGDVGYIKDHYSKTRDNAFSVNGEFGPGKIVEVGVNLHTVFSPTVVQEWKAGNLARNAFAFHENDSIYQGVYFRNPSEKTIGNEAFTKALGDDNLVRIKLGGQGTAYPYAMPILERFTDNKKLKDTTVLNDYRTTKHQRDKRSQIITYLTAAEASRVGMDTDILSYPLNAYPLGGCLSSSIDKIGRFQTGVEPLRKSHHISEIDVLNPDGRRYIYGIPVYNLSQEDATFATNTTTANPEQIATYEAPGSTVTSPPTYYAGDNSIENKKGRDNYYQSESLPPYAHSFLLTGLLSPDYVDVKGDGITEDDLGDAVKFNYSQIKNLVNSSTGFNWRAPFTKEEYAASFNEGLKTDNKDNKVSYSFGKRELWYLNSIESKNMIATFKLVDRLDAKEAKGKDGGILPGDSLLPGMKLLKQIDLYSKADKINESKPNGVPAKPIKTVHFEYAYELCQNVPTNISSTDGRKGKLTLKSIWFSYNGNQKQKENRYRFNYHSNPSYDRAANDRWGNYKPMKDDQNNVVNPSGMNNTDYPFAVQQKAQADQFAAAWTLNEVQLPSGGKIKVTYEADDYAYVQNRRAQQMYLIAGMGESAQSTPTAQLYKRNNLGAKDYLYVFIDTKVTGNTAATAKRYFEGIKQLYMKLYVTMPTDMYGGGTEPVPVYAEIEGNNYGVHPNNSQYLYVKVNPIRGSFSPMSSCAIQFLRDYLPSKAYPGSDIKLASGPKSVILALKGLKTAVTGAFQDFEGSARNSGKCNSFDKTRSYIRLNSPSFQKLGGGHRVKRVEITDNWEELTGERENSGSLKPGTGMVKATYGQQYDYTTIKEVDGKKEYISSGVATYEPGIGSEENPFREILRYSDRQPLGPTQNGAVEVPVGEMFYPSPMVGYSKVTVRSINRDTVKSGVGKQVTEFYTSKDFPVLSDFTDFDNTSKVNFSSNPILQILKLDMRQTTTLSQGFRVQLNDMNGKIKSQSSYAEDTSTLITYTANYYRLQKKTDETFQLDNNLLAVKGSDGLVSQTPIGKEVEMMVDFREHTTRTISTNLDFNINVAGIPPFIAFIPSLIPPVSYEEAIYRSATLMKVVNQYGILDSVVSIDKGSQVTTKDLVYDGETGNVLLTRTNNEFNAPVYNFNYPAHWAYSGMHPAYRNIDLTYKNVTFRHGLLINSPQVNQNYFESGDELHVLDYGESWLDDTEACALAGNNNTPCAVPAKILKSFEKRIWALDARKDKTNLDRSFIFIDRNGKPYSADNVTFRIVRSGKRNMLNESVGSITSRFTPLITEGGQLKIKPQDNIQVLNTAATTYKDHWRVTDQFYIQTSLVETKTPASVYHLTLNPVSIFNMKAKRNSGSPCCADFQNFDNPGYFEAWKWDQGNNKPDFESKSWMLFDFTYLPTDAVVINSNLSLPAHSPENIGCKSYPPVKHINYGSVVHENKWAHHSELKRDNLSRLSRMVTPWYASSDPAWRNVFLGSLIDPLTARTIVTTKPNMPFSSANIPYTDVTSMVQAMSNTRNFNATGMSLSLINGPNKKEQMNICFTGKDACSKPTLDIYYYSCSQAQPVSGSSAKLVNLNVPDPQRPLSSAYYCTTYVYETRCLSYFNKAMINPYVHGILGNWRTERSYTFYGERKDKIIANSSPLDLRSAGTIQDFKTYWNLSNDSLRTAGPYKEWVWNSEITQFNKRGFEVENHDPLDRFNSGLYGYAQALPTAVANNAKYREIAFDGFEDYYYSSTPCAASCQPRRHLNITDSTKISSQEAHTGKYSLQVTSAQHSIIVNNAIGTIAQDTGKYNLRIKLDSTRATKIRVTPNGKGLLSEYYFYFPNPNPPTSYIQPAVEVHNGQSYKYDPYVFVNWHQRKTPDSYYIIKWKGMVQPKVSGDYTFVISSDDGERLRLKEHSLTPIPPINNISDQWLVGVFPRILSQKVTLKAGDLYDIELDYFQRKGDKFIGLKWIEPCKTEVSEIDTKQFYPPGTASDTIPSVRDTLWCVKPDTIQARGHFLTDTFSLLPGKKMVLSAWVKENKGCLCDSYKNNQITIGFIDVFGNALPAPPSFKPAGAIIEGWQRYESEFIVPDDAKIFQMALENTGSSGTVYFDDIRIHPFNSNLKSFVYHPSNLRLMAELDENNYASFYEYDDDGTLVRVKKETMKGIKTINETRSSLQKVLN